MLTEWRISRSWRKDSRTPRTSVLKTLWHTALARRPSHRARRNRKSHNSCLGEIQLLSETHTFASEPEDVIWLSGIRLHHFFIPASHHWWLLSGNLPAWQLYGDSLSRQCQEWDEENHQWYERWIWRRFKGILQIKGSQCRGTLEDVSCDNILAERLTASLICIFQFVP